ncbi:unnamed protein product [Rotaria magnacalcarata]
MEIVIEEKIDDLPIARPSPTGLARHPAPLDFSDFSDLPEIFDEWLPAPTPGQKRKLGHRQDNPPNPSSPRLPPPPIIPRKTLPPRNSNVPLVGGSLPPSPINDTVNNYQKQRQYSFNTLFPSSRSDEKETTESPNIIPATVNTPSMIISPIRKSTPELLIKSPSVIPKNSNNNITSDKTYNFAILPIECRYYFKQTRQRCTFETIRIHQNFLQNKYETLDSERETKLHSSFDKQVWTQVVNFIKNILEKTLESKKKDDERRLDNLRLDQIREEATLEIKKIASSSEQQYIYELQEKFKRTLDLKLQYDKLEKRFVENMPPPSLNVFDKLELHAKELRPDNNQLKSLRERWKNVLRKTKLDLTTLMREGKIIEMEEATREYDELLNKLSDRLREAYNAICHGVCNERKLVYALSHHHPGFPKSKLHPHFSRINFPPQANNKAALLRETESRILNLGPKFVPPAPEQVLERLPNEIRQMKEKVSTAWRRVTKTIGRQPPIVDKFCKRIEDEIRKTVATEAPSDPALKPAIAFFRKIQKKNNIIFRQTDKSKVFHTDTRENYVKKSEIYMNKTNAYIEIQSSPLKEMIEKTDKFLRSLVSSKRIPQSLLDKLRPSLTESELPHLYYNPKDHKIGEPLRPIVSGMQSPLTKISSFLDRHIRPLFDRHTPYSISDSMIFLRRLQEFKTTNETNIYTFDITDMYTMIPQRESVLAVCEFLGTYGYKKVCGLSINTIKDLFIHVLENSYFVLQLPGLKPKYYRQTRGGAMGSACTQVLADIYIRKWEREFLQEQLRQHELYFRFRDDTFFTSRRLPEQIEKSLKELNQKDPNISITWTSGKTIEYLDVKVTIETPHFRTTVFRKLAAQPYVLPFNSAHPPHITRNIPYAAALRATRICSHPEDLQRELETIRITLLLNKYPPKFIDKHVGRFFHDLTGNDTSEVLLGKDHQKYRQRVLDRAWNKKEKRKINFRTDVLLHFTYTPSLINFGSHFHHIWQEIFEGTPLDDIPVIYANRLTDSLKHILVQKKPSKEAIKLLPTS